VLAVIQYHSPRYGLRGLINHAATGTVTLKARMSGVVRWVRAISIYLKEWGHSYVVIER